MSIKVDEWLEELASLTRKADAGQTVTELSEAAGKSERVIREWLKKAHRRGLLTVGRRTITAIDGKAAVAPVYSVNLPRGEKP